MASDPLAIPTAPNGIKKMDAPVVTERCISDHSTMGSSVISDRISGSSNPPGGKSPTLSKPSRMRNR